jgi:DNA repair exonuclease SbcCD nuclease subunit
MNLKSFKLAELSDVHLGHSTTPTEHILNSLRAAFPSNSETAALDMIVIAGDLFDRLLNLPEDDVSPIRRWMNDFLRMCKRHDIVLRVLEGTPSHDWKQSAMFEEINEIADIGADCKYVSNLSIEYIERFGFTFLYVPDEWRPDPNQTWQEVLALLKENNLDKVDFGIMHGFFPHQLPAHLVPGSHDPERYLGIVSKVIFIGHVHKFSEYDRIYSAGSTDRISHGEESPKGHLRYTLEEDGTYRVKFIENVNAMIYKSIDCTGLDGEDLHREVEKVIATLPKRSAVRLISPKSEVASASLKYFKDKYTDFIWSMKVDAKTFKHAEELIVKRRDQKIVKITKDNIVPLLHERLKVKRPDQAESCVKILKDVVDGK